MSTERPMPRRVTARSGILQ